MHSESESLVTLEQIVFLGRVVLEDCALRCNFSADRRMSDDDVHQHAQSVRLALRVVDLLPTSLPSQTKISDGAILDISYIFSFLALASSRLEREHRPPRRERFTDESMEVLHTMREKYVGVGSDLLQTIDRHALLMSPSNGALSRALTNLEAAVKCSGNVER